MLSSTPLYFESHLPCIDRHHSASYIALKKITWLSQIADIKLLEPVKMADCRCLSGWVHCGKAFRCIARIFVGNVCSKTRCRCYIRGPGATGVSRIWNQEHSVWEKAPDEGSKAYFATHNHASGTVMKATMIFRFCGVALGELWK